MEENNKSKTEKLYSELIKKKFYKTKAKYYNKEQRYVMEVKPKNTLQQIIFYPNNTIKEAFKLYNKNVYKLFGGVPDNNTQLIRSWYEPFDFYSCFWYEKNKLFEVDGPNDYRVDRMYMEDKTGVYVYQQDCSANDLL